MHFVELGHRMLGTFWEHFGVKWASDGALMGHWTHMDTKMRAQVDKIANLDAIWSQLGPFWVQLGLQLGVPGRPLEAHLLTLGGLDWLSWGQDGPKTPQEALQDRFLTQHNPPRPIFEAYMAPESPPRRRLESNFG